MKIEEEEACLDGNWEGSVGLVGGTTCEVLCGVD